MSFILRSDEGLFGSAELSHLGAAEVRQLKGRVQNPLYSSFHFVWQ